MFLKLQAKIQNARCEVLWMQNIVMRMYWASTEHAIMRAQAGFQHRAILFYPAGKHVSESSWSGVQELHDFPLLHLCRGKKLWKSIFRIRIVQEKETLFKRVESFPSMVTLWISVYTENWALEGCNVIGLFSSIMLHDLCDYEHLC